MPGGLADGLLALSLSLTAVHAASAGSMSVATPPGCWQAFSIASNAIDST